VFAAASLREAFTRLGWQFEAAHPGAKVASAQAFTDYVLSADGAGVLTAAGFAKP
jgi:ABC-type molybdate transport system substrate-binding protein